MWPNPQFPTSAVSCILFSADLVTFTEEVLNGKLHFFVQWNVGMVVKILIYVKKILFGILLHVIVKMGNI